MKKVRKIQVDLILILCLMLTVFAGINIIENKADMPLGIETSARTPHSAISIDGNDALNNFCDGNGTTGTAANPHVIENYAIISGSDSERGIEIENTHLHLIIRNCVIENYNYSIYLKYCHNITIVDCLMKTSNDYGVYTWNIADVIFDNNKIHDTNCGMLIDTAKDVTIENNNVSSCSAAGVYVGFSDWVKVQNNSISDCDTGDGIIIQSAYNTTIYDNQIFLNDAGIWLDSGSDNLIWQNNISENDRGISCTAHENMIWFNLFSDNEEYNAWSDEETNQWDNGTTGNYWGNYTERYASATNNGDVWNTDYEIYGDSTNEKDRFPLVTPFSYDATPPSLTLTTPTNDTIQMAGDLIHFEISDPISIDTVLFQWGSNNNVSQTAPYNTFLLPGTGPHTLKVFANDTNGNAILRSYTWITNDRPGLTAPDDLNFTLGEDTDPTVSWDVTDLHQTGSATYNVTSDGSLLTSGTWSGGDTIEVDLSDLTEGTYTLNITVDDGYGGIRSDVVTIQVNASPGLGLYAWIGIGAGGVAAVAVVTILLRKRGSKPQEGNDIITDVDEGAETESIENDQQKS